VICELGKIRRVWLQNTTDLKEFIDIGFKAIVSCVDSKALNKSFAGNIIDKNFLTSFSATIDPGGENGEFHTFVNDGPNFAQPAVSFSAGQSVCVKASGSVI